MPVYTTIQGCCEYAFYGQRQYGGGGGGGGEGEGGVYKAFKGLFTHWPASSFYQPAASVRVCTW